MGDIGGVGLVFNQSTNSIVVSSIVPGGPAAKDGFIRIGDVIVGIGDTDVRGMSLTDVKRLVVGPPDTNVELAFYRRGEPDFVRVMLTRRIIPGTSRPNDLPTSPLRSSLPSSPYANQGRNSAGGLLHPHQSRSSAPGMVRGSSLSPRRPATSQGLVPQRIMSPTNNQQQQLHHHHHSLSPTAARAGIGRPASSAGRLAMSTEHASRSPNGPVPARSPSPVAASLAAAASRGVSVIGASSVTSSAGNNNNNNSNNNNNNNRNLGGRNAGGSMDAVEIDDNYEKLLAMMKNANIGNFGNNKGNESNNSRQFSGGDGGGSGGGGGLDAYGGPLDYVPADISRFDINSHNNSNTGSNNEGRGSMDHQHWAAAAAVDKAALVSRGGADIRNNSNLNNNNNNNFESQGFPEYPGSTPNFLDNNNNNNNNANNLSNSLVNKSSRSFSSLLGPNDSLSQGGGGAAAAAAKETGMELAQQLTDMAARMRKLEGRLESAREKKRKAKLKIEDARADVERERRLREQLSDDLARVHSELQQLVEERAVRLQFERENLSMQRTLQDALREIEDIKLNSVPKDEHLRVIAEKESLEKQVNSLREEIVVIAKQNAARREAERLASPPPPSISSSISPKGDFPLSPSENALRSLNSRNNNNNNNNNNNPPTPSQQQQQQKQQQQQQLLTEEALVASPHAPPPSQYLPHDGYVGGERVMCDLPPERVGSSAGSRRGSLGGAGGETLVGVGLIISDSMHVVDLVEGSSAWRSCQIREGDLVIAVGGAVVAQRGGGGAVRAMEMMRGPPRTMIDVVLERPNGQQYEVTLVREEHLADIAMPNESVPAPVFDTFCA